MSGPTLALGISAGGVDQVKLLADAVGLLDRNLASLQSRGGSSAGTASLGGLDQLLAEVQRIRQGVGEAAAGLRTEMADLKQTVSNSINDTMSSVGKAAQTASKQAGDQVETSFDSFRAKMLVGSEKIASAQAQAAEKEAVSTDAFIFRSNKSLAAFLKQRQAGADSVEKSGVDAYTAKLLVGSEKIASAQALAAQREEAANSNFVFRANKNLQTFLQQRQDEVAKVQRASQEIEAAYAASSKASQLRSQLGARTQLDQGIPTADVVAKFGSTATLGAQAKDAAALRKEIEAAAHSMDGFSLATSGAKRELLVIFGELVRGNYTRLASSLDVLIRQSGATNYVFSLTALAFAATATAAVLAAVAYAKGTFELHEFEKQARLTGDASGISAGQFTMLRDSLEGIGVTKGKAAEALTTIAASGLQASTNVKAIANAAIQLERAAGIPIEKTIKNFVDLSEKPAEASAKLNEKYHYLTAAVYSQIEALEKHGRTQDAATLAEQTYADVMTRRAQAIIDGQGYIEKGWHGIGIAAKRAWDAMLDVGREDSTADKLKKAVEALEDAQRRLALSRGQAQETGTGAAVVVRGVVSSTRAQRDLDSAQGSVADAFRRNEIVDSNAASAQYDAQTTAANVEFARLRQQHLGRQDKMEQELTRAQELGQRAGKSPEEIKDIQTRIRGQYDKGSSTAGDVAGRADAARAQTARYKDLIKNDDYTSAPQLTEAENQLYRIQEKLKQSSDALTVSHLRTAEAAAKGAIADEQAEQAAKKHYEAAKAEHEEIFKAAEANEKSADSIRAKASQVEQENANFGKSKTAIEQANLALMSNQLAEADSSDRFDPKYVASLRTKTDAQRDYVKQLQLAEAHQEQRKLNEDLRVAQEEAKTIAEENSLLGVSQQQRDRILAQRKSELQLAKQLADIDKLNLGDGPEADTQRQAMKDQARETARLKATNAENQKIYEQWQKTADDISNALTDALLSGFEHGKSAATQLRDTLKRMFSQLVLRPIIQAIMAPVSGQLTQMAGNFFNGTSGSGGTSGGSMNGLGSVQSYEATGLNYAGLGSLGAAGGSDTMAALSASNAAAAGGGASGAAELAGTAASNAGTGSIFASGAGAASSYLPYIGAAYAASQGNYGQAAGMAIGTMILPGIGTVIGAVIGSIVDSFSQKHGPKVESNYGNTIGRGDPTGATSIAEGIKQSYSQYATSFGVKDSTLSGLSVGYATDPQGTAQTQLNITGGNYSRASMYGGNIENVGRTDEEFKKAVELASAQLIVKNLQAAADGKVGDFLRTFNVTSSSLETLENALKVAQEVADFDRALDSLGNTFKDLRDASVTTTEQFIKDMGGLQNASSVLSSYFNNFYSSTEKRQATAQHISSELNSTGLSTTSAQILGMTRDQYRKLVEASQSNPGGKLYETLLSMSDAFASLTPAAEGAADAIGSLASVGKSLWEWSRNLGVTRAGTASPLDQLSAAQAAYEQDRSLAAGGNADAYGRLQESANAYVEAAKLVGSSSGMTQGVIDQVRSDLAALPQVESYGQQMLSATTDGTATVAGAITTQTSVLQGQLDALIAQVKALVIEAQAQTQVETAHAEITQSGNEAIVGAVQDSIYGAGLPNSYQNGQITWSHPGESDG